MRRGANLAFERVEQSDQFSFKIDPYYADSELDPSTGRQKANRLAERNDISYLVGAVSSGVTLALNGFAKKNEVIVSPGGAAVRATGEQCNKYVFRWETNVEQVADALAPWAVQNLGSKVWFHIANYAYGESVLSRYEDKMSNTTDSYERVGTSRSEIGAGSFGSYISKISDSDANVLVLGTAGGDTVNFLSQASNAGLKNEVDIVAPLASFKSARKGAGSAALGVYNGVRYNHKVDTAPNEKFVSNYRNRYDSNPTLLSAIGHQSVYMVAHGIEATGSKDPTKVKDTLPGMKIDGTVFGTNRFRKCNNQAVNPVWVGENVKGEAFPNAKLVKKFDGEDLIPPCSETNCEI
jgi:branched-chain amino acid transport system substrate-binding protein